MMEKLKFRFWDSKENRMYTDSPCFAIGSTGEVSLLKHHECIREGDCDCVEWEGTVYSEHIIPLQFTGLKDKNDKEIYEGDIVELTIRHYEDCSRRKLTSTENSIQVVSYDYSSFGLRENVTSTGLRPLLWITTFDYEIEIIGNIYESPNLIERKDNV